MCCKFRTRCQLRTTSRQECPGVVEDFVLCPEKDSVRPCNRVTVKEGKPYQCRACSKEVNDRIDALELRLTPPMPPPKDTMHRGHPQQASSRRDPQQGSAQRALTHMANQGFSSGRPSSTRHYGQPKQDANFIRPPKSPSIWETPHKAERPKLHKLHIPSSNKLTQGPAPYVMHRAPKYVPPKAPAPAAQPPPPWQRTSSHASHAHANAGASSRAKHGVPGRAKGSEKRPWWERLCDPGNTW